MKILFPEPELFRVGDYMTFRIAISGKANSGKNTLATTIFTQIQKHYPDKEGWGAKFIAFADPMKEMILQMYPQASRESLFGASHLRGTIIPGTNITYRQVLLDLGKLGRSHNQHLWVNNFRDRYQAFEKEQIKLGSQKYQTVVVSDVRFINEAMFLKKAGFYMIRLIRTQNNLKINDISETEQDGIPNSDFDQIIYNEKDIQHLEKEVLSKIIPNIK